MNKPRILVTGATGKTGTHVVQELIERGFPVRALARRVDERSSALEKLGAEVVVGDFHDLTTLRHAMTNVERAYFCYPPHLPDMLEAASNFAVAARDAGVTATVNMSQITSRENAPSRLTRQHWLAEQLLDHADIGAIHIRPTFFAENLIIFGSHSIAQEGRLYLPFGEELHAPIAAVDIGRTVATLLAQPDRHVGQRYRLTGPEKMSLNQMAAIIGAEIGREVVYADLPIEAWGQALREHVGLPEFLAAHMEAVAQDHRDGVFHAQTDTVEELTGEAPMPLRAFARENKGLFQTPGALINV